MKKGRLRILLADDHPIVRDGLRLLLEAQPHLHVVGEAADGQESLRKAHALRPDVVLMDLAMPRLNGLQATQRLRTELPNVKVVVLTAQEDEGYLDQLCQAGAAGYVRKRAASEDLLKAIDAVVRGELYFDPVLAAKVLALRSPAPTSRREQQSGGLSEREREVLARLAWGFTNKEIASDLRLSVKTIETYKARIANKLGLRSRTEMVRYALRNGWLNDEEGPPRRRPG